MKNYKRTWTLRWLCAAVFLATAVIALCGLRAEAASAKEVLPRLHVEGTHLVNEAGEIQVLRGVSTHGLAWYPQYVNKKAFKRLKKDWKANVVRLAMYTEEYGGYCAGGDRKALEKTIDDGVRYATELGLYVIIDWHILNDNDPGIHVDEAEKFFGRMSKKYKSHTNVIYEIANEPHGVSWHDNIKPYAKRIIKTIRKEDNKALIIVGTNTWSQDVDEVASDRLEDPGCVYAFHFYAATHGDDLRQKLNRALDAGVPVFVSECSICEASGNGHVDRASADAWLSLLENRQISYVAWNLSNKDEASSLISPGCQKLFGWSKDELSETGKWFRERMRAQRDE